MSETTFYSALLAVWISIAPVVFVLLLFVSAPYGRHTRAGWGPMIGRTTGWVVMESPSVFVFVGCLVVATRPLGAAALTLTALWLAHYVHRALVFPFRLRGGNARMPLSVVAMALCFNLVNGYLQGRYVGHFGLPFPQGWLADPRFGVGVLLFVAGLAVNLHADHVLLGLRRSAGGEDSYRVPHGGLFRWVSCPNYLGEVVEWTGWAVASWSLAGVAFALWTAANLVPRARANHRWYRERFADYPPRRKAILPFVY